MWSRLKSANYHVPIPGHRPRMEQQELAKYNFAMIRLSTAVHRLLHNLRTKSSQVLLQSGKVRAVERSQWANRSQTLHPRCLRW